MITTLSPTLTQCRLDLYDNIVYSYAPAPLLGRELALKMAIMMESTVTTPIHADTPRRPALIWVMGGAWRQCSREKALPELEYFARRGFVVAAPTYRVTSEAPYPAQIQDIMTAIRFLRAHADEYCIDTSRICVMGLSAGGHLAAMAGMNPQEYGGKEWADFSTHVSAAVDLFGITDIGLQDRFDASKPQAAEIIPQCTMVEGLLGGKIADHPDMALDANPISHISDRTVPILILHGDLDTEVPLQHGILLHDAMNAAGHEVNLFVLKGAGHGSLHFFQNPIKDLILEFLNKNLY